MAHLFTVKHYETHVQNSDAEQTTPEVTIAKGENGAAIADMPSSLSTINLEANSWIDSSPPTDDLLKLALVTRIDDIHKDIEDIQISVNNRELLIQLAAKNPKYVLVPNHAQNWAWKLIAEKDRRVFYALKSQVEDISDDASLEKIEEWEVKLGDLWTRTLNPTDKIDAGIAGWTSYIPGTFQEGWNWADASGKANSGTMEEPVSPKEKNMNPNKDAGLYSDLSTGYGVAGWSGIGDRDREK